MPNSKFKAGLDLLYLAVCGFHGTTPLAEHVGNMSLDDVYAQASRHSMAGITYIGLNSFLKTKEDTNVYISEELNKLWHSAFVSAGKKTVLFELEREKLLAFMERECIWYLPMKGIILQNYYPALGMRQMADNDIYFDNTRRADIKKYMLENGYTAKTYGKGAHDVYLKKPVFNFEMHAYLYTESFNDLFFRYYENIKNRFIKDEDNEYGYHLSKEDFYIYIITHLFKHFDHGGAGVRFLMDIYAYLIKENDTLDWQYIKGELKKLNLIEFEKSTRSLSFKLFSDTCTYFGGTENLLTVGERELLDYYIGSGTYGTLQNNVQHSLSKLSDGEEKNTKKVKGKYILRLLFPNMLYYKDSYPFLYKYRIFIPFFLLFRFIRAVILRPKKIIYQLKIIKKTK